MKRCRICNELKSLSDFYRAPGARDGHRGECKPCNLAQQAQRRAADPDLNRNRVREWRKANPRKVASQQARYRATGQRRAWSRQYHLRRKYGITVREYEEILATQGGVCAVCRRPPHPEISLHVDHDHDTGRIRGLLCFRCNNALGDLEDDPALLRAAARYLEPALPRDPAIERRLDELRSRRPAWELA